MPAYDFRCAACDITFEVVRPASETGDVCCPDCGAVAKRVFTPVGVHFKGSGFHSTDYRPKPSKSEEPACPAAGSSEGCSGCPSAKE